MTENLGYTEALKPTNRQVQIDELQQTCHSTMSAKGQHSTQYPRPLAEDMSMRNGSLRHMYGYISLSLLELLNWYEEFLKYLWPIFYFI